MYRILSCIYNNNIKTVSNKTIYKNTLRSFALKKTPKDYNQYNCDRSELNVDKKFKIKCASIVERLPSVLPETEKWESDYFEMSERLEERRCKDIPEGFWEDENANENANENIVDDQINGKDDKNKNKKKEGIDELSFQDKNDKTNEERIQSSERKKKTLSEEIDEDEIIGDGFKIPPVETEDDRLNNRKSLNRALRERLFLIVKKKNKLNKEYEWFFPTTTYNEKKATEKKLKMSDFAIAAVHSVFSTKLNILSIGYRPVGYISYLYNNNYKNDKYDGNKVFLYKSIYYKGDGKFRIKKYDDYLWVTKNELKDYLQPNLYNYIKQILP